MIVKANTLDGNTCIVGGTFMIQLSVPIAGRWCCFSIFIANGSSWVVTYINEKILMFEAFR